MAPERAHLGVFGFQLKASSYREPTPEDETVIDKGKTMHLGATEIARIARSHDDGRYVEIQVTAA